MFPLRRQEQTCLCSSWSVLWFLHLVYFKPWWLSPSTYNAFSGFLSLVSYHVWVSVVHLSYKPFHCIYENITVLKLLFVFIFTHIQLNLGWFLRVLLTINWIKFQIHQRHWEFRLCARLLSGISWCRHPVPLTALELGDLYIIIYRLKLSLCKRKDSEFQITHCGGWQHYNAKVGKWNRLSVINGLGTHPVFYIAILHCV